MNASTIERTPSHQDAPADPDTRTAHHAPTGFSGDVAARPRAEQVPIVELSGIHFTYPGSTVPVLRGATLNLMPGQRLGLLGHNGSGKTTLLHICMGLLRPGAGTIRHKGVEVHEDRGFNALRRGVGFLFQSADDQLFCPTVLEDVAFGPLNLGLTPLQARQRAEETLERLGLAGFGPRVTHRLSGGEKKMVALAAVMSMQPEALLLDEPTNDLDPATRERLIDVLAAASPTHIIISHDWDFLARTCTSFLTVRDGTVREARHIPHVHTHIHHGGEVAHDHAGQGCCHGHDNHHNETPDLHAHVGHAHDGHDHDVPAHDGHAPKG